MNNFLNPGKRIILGYSRDLLMDFDDNSVQLLPKTFAQYLQSKEESFEEYEKFIKEKNLRVSCVTNGNTNWDSFSHVTNLKVVISENNFTQKLLDICNLLIIEAIELVFYKVNESKVIEILNKFEDTFVMSLELTFSECVIAHEFYNQVIHHPLVHKLTVLNQKESKQEMKNKEGVPVLVQYSTSSLIGTIKADLSSANFTLLTESQKHHTYFNRKLYIGQNGEIKNAPECEEEFGKIQDLKNVKELKELISTDEFQKYWYIHKELIDVCKDCEFRHMCVDNRIPYKRKENEWYHKIECNYNPYIAKWEGEEGYSTLSECGVISDENGFTIDHKKITEINQELWGD